MVINRGTFEGDKQEIEFVKNYNQNKFNNIYSFYNNSLNSDTEKTFLVRVTTKQYSKLSNQIVMTRADAYGVIINYDITNVLIDNEYYLDENILNDFNINYTIIEKSGISIKMVDSEKYQILKLTPNSFNNLFGNTELGAAASLFCKKEVELFKNHALLNGWHTSIENMCVYFNELNLNDDFINNIEQCKMLKTFANHKIVEIVECSNELQLKIFNGVYIYEEPYTAHYKFINGVLDLLIKIPFSVTTGSGRSNGKYTIVLKPC